MYIGGLVMAEDEYGYISICMLLCLEGGYCLS